MANAGTPQVPPQPAVPQGLAPAQAGPRPAGGFSAGVAADLVGFSPRRTITVARLMVREASQLRLWIVLVAGMAAVLVADMTAAYFDPVVQTAAGLIGNSQLAITLVGIAVALFLSTYSIPREVTSKTVYSLVTKPVSRLEIVAGKMLGLAAVLAALTFGLGLACYGYMLFRGGQVQQLARQRLEAIPAGDDRPQALQSIADHGPFMAAIYQAPSQPLTLVHLEGSGPAEWLSGYPTHRAHWGFRGLPIDQLDTGGSRVVVQLTWPSTLPAPTDEQRTVRVQLYDPERSRDDSFALRLTADAAGRLELPIPGIVSARDGFYSGGRLWVSLCGEGRMPLGVRDDSCTILLPDGRQIASESGLKLTTSFSANKYWIGGHGSNRMVVGRVRYSSGDVSDPRGLMLRVDVAVPTASNIPAGAQAQVVIVNERGDRQEASFRPEKGMTALVPIEPEIARGGDLTVYLRSADPRVEIGVTDESVHLQVGRRPFLLNWAKALTMLWLGFCVIAAMGLCVSTLVGWYVAVLLTSVAVVVCHVWPSMIQQVGRLGFSDLGIARGSEVDRALSQAYATAFRMAGHILPDFGRMDYGGIVARGLDAPLESLVGVPYGAAWYALLYIAVLVTLGYLIFRRREVAQ
jgi:hypothetical protein